MKEFFVSFFLFLALLATFVYLANKEPQVITKVITKESVDTERLKEENLKLKKQLQTERQLRIAQRDHYQQYVVAYNSCKQSLNSFYNCR